VPFGPLTSIADVRSFLEFRCNLESEMATLAAVHYGKSELAAIRSARKALERALAEGQSGIEHDIAFHAAIAHASGNRFYVMTLAALSDQTHYSIGLIRDLSGRQPPLRAREVNAEHALIEKAIAARDGDAAAAAMREHLRGGMLRLFGK
jgi:DNA-binding FadR family transcriptional regulator